MSCHHSLFFLQEPGKRRLDVLASTDAFDLPQLQEAWLEQFFDGRPTCALDLAEEGPEEDLAKIGASVCLNEDEAKMTLKVAVENLLIKIRRSE